MTQDTLAPQRCFSTLTSTDGRITRIWSLFEGQDLTFVPLVHCLDHTPDGALWPHTDRVRHVPGWVRYRLAAWAGLASPSQQRAAQHQELLAEQAQRGAEWAAVRAAAASPDARRAHAARVRELLRRSPTAARILDRRAAG